LRRGLRENAIQPALAERNFQSSARSKSKGADSGNVSEKEILKAGVVRNVQEYRTIPEIKLCVALVFCAECAFLNFALPLWEPFTIFPERSARTTNSPVLASRKRICRTSRMI
jgi:hypothetical protein